MQAKFLFVLLCLVATALAGCRNVSKVALPPLNSHKHVIYEAMNHHYSDSVEALLKKVTEDNVVAHLQTLTGESSQTRTRVTTSIDDANGIMSAVRYARERLTSFGFEVTLHEYRNGWAPNVVATKRGGRSPGELVIMGAHLDDIPASGRAPGANDDGSGSSALLAIAQAVHEAGAEFDRTLVLELYTGEEQGLVGSRALAAKRARDGDDVVAMLQQDMTGVFWDGDGLGVAFVQDANAVDPSLTDACLNIAREYAPAQFTVHTKVLSGSSCCSDHQSYRENGFSSVGYIEPRGYTGDPQYHKVGDVSKRDDYSVKQVTETSRLALASAAVFAVLR